MRACRYVCVNHHTYPVVFVLGRGRDPSAEANERSSHGLVRVEFISPLGSPGMVSEVVQRLLEQLPAEPALGFVALPLHWGCAISTLALILYKT